MPCPRPSAVGGRRRNGLDLAKPDIPAGPPGGAMGGPVGPTSRLVVSVHGAAAVIDCAAADLCAPAEHLLGPFRVPALPATPVPVSGSVLPYDVADGARSVRAAAR